jgi:hypothetical protein
MTTQGKCVALRHWVGGGLVTFRVKTVLVGSALP